MSQPIDLRSMDLDQLEAWVLSIGETKYRAKQIYQWLWKKGVAEIAQMTDLSITLREKLGSLTAFKPIQLDKSQVSTDGTIKSRFVLHDGHKIESVLIPVEQSKRYTVCVSTQVGCSLTCSFCATGKMKRLRNLEAAEIVDQFFLVNQQSLEQYATPLSNIVYMGMGEPLLNYKEVIRSTQLLTHHLAIGLSPNRITVSTAGIAKMIRQLGDDQVRFNLALSLHAADDIKRNEIMPINESNNLEILMDALEYFYYKTRNDITYEYIAFNNFNDTLLDAQHLVSLCKRNFPVKVNIIEYNPIGGVAFVKTTQDRLDIFTNYLYKHGVYVTVRRSRGKDIDAACGQLANKE
ncbi:MAG: 23S rRNA (adenine(2503)-C(2))-methyltransferase RlmN [Saprospiraceae bacterium]|nr:23S rRNA (adenine(2503)-C(2))-methyltransferase RlmN [Saprospiraceae bacterium]